MEMWSSEKSLMTKLQETLYERESYHLALKAIEKIIIDKDEPLNDYEKLILKEIDKANSDALAASYEVSLDDGQK